MERSSSKMEINAEDLGLGSSIVVALKESN